jgi:hypothetical protein
VRKSCVREVDPHFRRTAEVERLLQLAISEADQPQVGGESTFDFMTGKILEQDHADQVIIAWLEGRHQDAIGLQTILEINQDQHRVDFDIPRGVSPTNYLQRAVVRAEFLTRESIKEVTSLRSRK